MNELKHVAYLIPHTDVTGETDCKRMLPDHVIHAERMWLDDVSEQGEQKMVREELPRAIQYLKGITPYCCAVFGCTSASVAYGKAGMEQIEAQMREELRCPATTVFGAVLREIRARQAKHVTILTPYIDEVNGFLRNTMEQFDVPVAYITGMGLVSDHDIAALTPETILHFAAEQAPLLPAETDLCFFSCTNVRSAEVREALADILHRPVITSNQCVIDFIKACPQL